MIRILAISFAITAGLIGSVTTSQSATGPESEGALPAEHISPDKALILRFRLQSPQSTYQLVEAATGRLLATAESAIRPNDVYKGRFRGGLEILFAPQNSSVNVREDISDASPAVRFIYFERQQDGSYLTYYLTPPVYRW